MAQVVFSHTATPPRKHRRRMGAAASAFKGADGRWHIYLNAEVPRDTSGTIDDSLCKRCSYGYSHVLVQAQEICDECRIEAIAERAMYIQALIGIDLGWRMPEDYSPDMVRHSHRYQERKVIHPGKAG